MRKLLLIISFVSSQNITAQRRIEPKVAIGVAYRLEPIVLERKLFTIDRYGFTYTAISSGINLSVDIYDTLRMFKQDFLFEFSSYFRHGYFRTISPDPNSSRSIDEYRFKHDHFIDIIYPFRIKKSGLRYRIGAGYGVMNCGTGFRYDRFTGEHDPNGNPVINNTRSKLQFSAPRLILGFQKKRINADLIVHGTPDYDRESYPTLWIEAKLAYVFTPFKKGN